MPRQDYVYVGTELGFSVPMRPVKWDLRKKGNPNTLVSGGKKDMVEISHVSPSPSVNNTYPVSISVMGQIWEIQASWENECDRLEMEARRDAALRREAEVNDQEEIDAYTEFSMDRFLK